MHRTICIAAATLLFVGRLGCTAAVRLPASGQDGIVQQPILKESPPMKVAAIDNRCAREPALLTMELTYASRMAAKAAQHFTPDNAYVRAFWPNKPEEIRNYYTTGTRLQNVRESFECISIIAGGGTDASCGHVSPLKITCEEDETCRDTKINVHAHTDRHTITINLCNRWFGEPDTQTITCRDGRLLSTYESKALTLTHELTHLDVEPQGYTLDIDDMHGHPIYGANKCNALASNDMPNVPSNQAVLNADNHAWIAAGNYWFDFCRESNPNFRLPPHIPDEKLGL